MLCYNSGSLKFKIFISTSMQSFKSSYSKRFTFIINKIVQIQQKSLKMNHGHGNKAKKTEIWKEKPEHK